MTRWCKPGGGWTPPADATEILLEGLAGIIYGGQYRSFPAAFSIKGLNIGSVGLGISPNDLFTAAASVIINLTDESANACHPSRAVPILMMNGTADPLIPYEGGRGTSWFAMAGFWSTAKTLDFWRRVNSDPDFAMTNVDNLNFYRFSNPQNLSASSCNNEHCVLSSAAVHPAASVEKTPFVASAVGRAGPRTGRSEWSAPPGCSRCC